MTSVSRCCFCIPLGVSMFLAAFFAFVELAWTVYIAKTIYHDIDNKWALINVVLIGVKAAPVITFANLAITKESVFSREVNHQIFTTS